MYFMLNKKKASLGLKIFAGVVAFSFVAGMVWFAVDPFLGVSGGQSVQTDPSMTREEKVFSDDARMYEAIVTRTSTDTTSWVMLGNTYYDWGYYLALQKKDTKGATDKWMKAISAYNKALELNPDDKNVKNDLGSLYFYLNDIEKAKKQWEEILSREPTFSSALFNLGLANKTLNNTETAISFFEKYLKVAEKSDKNIEQAKKYITELKSK